MLNKNNRNKLSYRLSIATFGIWLFLFIMDIIGIFIFRGTIGEIYLIMMLPFAVLSVLIFYLIMYYNYSKTNGNKKTIPTYFNKKLSNKIKIPLIIIYILIIITDIAGALINNINLILIFTIMYTITVAIVLLRPSLFKDNNA